jgi:hypothetical protein
MNETPGCLSRGSHSSDDGRGIWEEFDAAAGRWLYDGSHRHRQLTEGRPVGAPFARLEVARSCREEPVATARPSGAERRQLGSSPHCDGSHRHRQPTEGRPEVALFARLAVARSCREEPLAAARPSGAERSEVGRR